jgi:hypothetical protein
MTYPSIQIVHVQTNVEYKHWPVRKFEDIKGAIRRRKLKKDRQYDDQKKKDIQWFT